MRKILTLVIVATLLLCSGSAALADEESGANTSTQPSLTLEQAVDMALQNSNAVKSQELTVKSTENSLDQTSRYYGGIVPAGSTNETLQTNFISLKNAGISWEMAKKNLTVKQDAAMYTTIKDYVGVLSAIDSLNAAKLSASNAQIKLSNAQISNMVGVASNYDWESAQSGFTTAKTGLTQAQVNLNKAYQALNRDLGLEADARPVLTEKPEFSTYQVYDVDAEIARTVEASPSVWNSDKAVETAQMSSDLYNWNAGVRTTPYENTQIGVSQAKITADNTRLSTETLLRNTYNSILTAEQQYESQKKALHVAEENYRIGKIKFDIGMLTKADLNDLEAAVATANATLNATIYSHELNKMVFEKPWAAS